MDGVVLLGAKTGHLALFRSKNGDKSRSLKAH
jgi:hypothetical protein